QFGHETLSTFGVGAAFSEVQLRAVLRQLLALGAVHVDAQAYNTLVLAPAARAVLKGERAIALRETSAARLPKARKVAGKGASTPAAAALDAPAQARLAALKAWRAEVARSHNLPAYVIFHDATLVAIAERAPESLAALDGISGIGEKKRAAYGEELLQALRTV
ncbi:MAG TPA: HRDC domain-containing protein, partial [Burkholderiaceae bacterium]